MTTTILFVTAKMPTTRVNRFLRECQTIRDLVQNSMYGLIRSRSIPLMEIDAPGTEPPVEEFNSGYIGATDDDLWEAHARCMRAENERKHAGFIVNNTVLALDETSTSQDTVAMLYRTQDDRICKWRVKFRFLPAVTADLPDEEETYLKPGMADSDGILDMKKIKDTIGAVWKYE